MSNTISIVFRPVFLAILLVAVLVNFHSAYSQDEFVPGQLLD